MRLENLFCLNQEGFVEMVETSFYSVMESHREVLCRDFKLDAILKF